MSFDVSQESETAAPVGSLEGEHPDAGNDFLHTNGRDLLTYVLKGCHPHGMTVKTFPQSEEESMWQYARTFLAEYSKIVVTIEKQRVFE